MREGERGDTHVILVLALLVLQKQLQALFPNLRLNMPATAVPRLAIAVVLPFLLQHSSAFTVERDGGNGEGYLGLVGLADGLGLAVVPDDGHPGLGIVPDECAPWQLLSSSADYQNTEYIPCPGYTLFEQK